MPIEVTTKVKNLSLSGHREPVVVMTVTVLPRGSGNRNTVRRLARAFREDPIMGSHLSKVVCGTTSVHVHIKATFGAWAAVMERIQQAREATEAVDPKQMMLPLAGA